MIEAHMERIDANIESARRREALVLKVIADLQEERAKYEAEAEGVTQRVSDAKSKGAHNRHHVKGDKPNADCDFCIEEELV
jgi:hypothetical protein